MCLNYAVKEGVGLAQCAERATTCYTAENGRPGFKSGPLSHVFPLVSLCSCFPVLSSLCSKYVVNENLAHILL